MSNDFKTVFTIFVPPPKKKSCTVGSLDPYWVVGFLTSLSKNQCMTLAYWVQEALKVSYFLVEASSGPLKTVMEKKILRDPPLRNSCFISKSSAFYD